GVLQGDGLALAHLEDLAHAADGDDAARVSQASPLRGLAPEKAAAAVLAHELAVAHSDLAADCDHARPTVELEALEGAVIHVHLVGLGADHAAVTGVVHHQV